MFENENFDACVSVLTARTRQNFEFGLNLDLDHAWPLVSWPMLSDQKQFPHSTLIYLYVSSDPEPDIPDTWGWCINIGQDQGGMNDWCLYCTYTYGMNVFIILVNAVYSTEWWVILGETNFFLTVTSKTYFAKKYLHISLRNRRFIFEQTL